MWCYSRLSLLLLPRCVRHLSSQALGKGTICETFICRETTHTLLLPKLSTESSGSCLLQLFLENPNQMPRSSFSSKAVPWDWTMRASSRGLRHAPGSTCLDAFSTDFLDALHSQKDGFWYSLLRSPPKSEDFLDVKDEYTWCFFEELGFRPSELEDMLSKFPGLLGLSVSQSIEPALMYLRSLGIPNEALREMACTCPRILALSVDEELEPTYSGLRSSGLRTIEIATLLQKQPQARANHLYGHELSGRGIGSAVLAAPSIVLGGQLEDLKARVLLVSGLARAGGWRSAGDLLAAHPRLLEAPPKALGYMQRVLERRGGDGRGILKVLAAHAGRARWAGGRVAAQLAEGLLDRGRLPAPWDGRPLAAAAWREAA
mmetsp:Transcript_34416/g.81563  ORF Transcript_34416/g.81563 Transcript_34416/m.81563 type:complete len:374 (-) Transcript_34416:239-1360(-)